MDYSKALASLSAYLIGQLADILVFQRLREMKQWWPAPTASSIFGNLLDTYAFFAIAFYHTNDAFMAEHWIGIGFVDYLVKITANLVIFLPVYGVRLNYLIKKIEDQLYRANRILEIDIHGQINKLD